MNNLPRFINRSQLYDTKEKREPALIRFRGKRIVIYFYPKDMTPGCTKESCEFRDYSNEYKSSNTEIIGISPDDLDSHNLFISEYSLPFLLLSDVDHKVCELFGVWKLRENIFPMFLGTMIPETQTLPHVLNKRATSMSFAARALILIESFLQCLIAIKTSKHARQSPEPTVDYITQAFWQACSGGQRRAAEYLLSKGAPLRLFGHHHYKKQHKHSKELHRLEDIGHCPFELPARTIRPTDRYV